MLESAQCCASPPTTPGSVDDEELLPKKPPQDSIPIVNKIFYSQPFVILAISSLQIFFFLLSHKFPMRDLLRFEPDNQTRIWRFVTYMLVHTDWFHLTQNVILQCLFAYHLEKHQKHWKIATLYIASGVTGALGASCFRPEDVIGASAGVYGLLMSHLPHLIINTQMKHKLYKMVGVIIIVIFDVVFNVVHYYKVKAPLISWGAHVFGAVTGFSLGFALFSDPGKPAQSTEMKNKICRIIGGILYTSILIILAFVDYGVRLRADF